MNNDYQHWVRVAKLIDAAATSESAIWDMYKAGTISWAVADFMTDGRGYLAARGAELIYGKLLPFVMDECPGCLYCGRILPVGASGCTHCNEYKGLMLWTDMHDYDEVDGFFELHFFRSLEDVDA